METKSHHDRAHGRDAYRLAKCLPGEDALRLIHRLWDADMLKVEPKSFSGLATVSQVSCEELFGSIKESLSNAGWHGLVFALRCHNRCHADRPWELTRPADFLAALEMSLGQRQGLEGEGVSNGRRAAEVGREQEARPGVGAGEEPRRPGQSLGSKLRNLAASGWLLSPRALWVRLRGLAHRSLAQAESESALGRSALYAARMEGAEVERDLAFAKVDKLRDKLHNQLQVFCHEQGIPLPTPYSREEAYCLHLLATYFASLAQAEGMIAKRGSILARRQIALEGMRAEASLDGRILPPLLDYLWEIDPLREALSWERIRHRTALMVGGVLAAIVGGVSGVVESISDVFIAGLTRYAPVAAPVLLVGLLTLAAQTITGGVPLTWGALVQYIARATWNASIALGAAVVAYGSWQYLRAQRQRQEAASQPTPGKSDGEDVGTKT